MVSPIVMGGYPLCMANRAAGWDPSTDEGRAQAVQTVRAALDAGINMVDTGAMYGDGLSERIFGEAIAGRRDDLIVASKVAWPGATADSVLESIEGSLERLGTDRLDIIQIHGNFHDAEAIARIEGVVLPALETARERGLADHIGITAEEAATLIPLVRTGRFDMVQTDYNFIQQGAASHLLPLTSEMGVGVLSMRPLTSGVVQEMAAALMPEMASRAEWFELCLRFAMSDSRVSAVNVGMRWPREVEQNVAWAEGFEPAVDLAGFPRGIGDLYRHLDAAVVSPSAR
jgi:aryl-alcohol dehydrogenase-like predicted oxidoreductase